MVDEQLLNQALERHCHRYHCSSGGIAVVHAPGRVNIIGEHTDYNLGYVLPAPLRLGITALASIRSDGKVGLASDGKPEPELFDLSVVTPELVQGWTSYPLGVIKLVEQAGSVPGINLSYVSDLPIGAGLSSSAALEVVTLRSLKTFMTLRLTPREEVQLCQRAEREYAKVNCGIMDQMVSHLGSFRQAMLIDCLTLDYSTLSLAPLIGQVVVFDSGVKHGLRESGYNTRRAECEQALAAMHAYNNQIQTFRDLTEQTVISYKEILPQPLYQRAFHVVTENARVLKCVQALKNNSIAEVGTLLNQSHASLRDHFAVSCNELDVLVELCRRQSSCYGARMIGGGFGGSVVALTAEQSTESFCRRIAEQYSRQTGRSARYYTDIL